MITTKIRLTTNATFSLPQSLRTLLGQPASLTLSKKIVPTINGSSFE